MTTLLDARGTPLVPADKTPVRLIACPNPFSVARVDTHLPAGGTVQDMIRIAGVSAELEPFVVVWLADASMRADPIFIPRVNWTRVRPKPGIVVTLRAAPGKGGGGGGKNPLRTILTIAVIAATIYFAPQLGAAISQGLFGAGHVASGLTATQLLVGKAIAGAGIGLVGNLIVNAIAPPPKPRLAELSGGGLGSVSRTSPTLAITGTQNQANRFGVVPRVYGRVRMFPPLAAHAYSETEGDKQYFRMLFDFGYGPLRISGLRIGTVPLDHFEGVETELRQGYPDDEPITLYSQTVREDGYNLKLTRYGGTQVVETRDDTNEVIADFAFAGLVRFDGAGNRQSRKVKIRVEYRPAGSSQDLWLVGDQEYEAETEQSVVRGVRFIAPDTGRYEVHLTRLSPDNVDWKQEQMDEVAYWAAYQDVADDSYYGDHTPGRAWEHWVNHGEGEGRRFYYLEGETPTGGDSQIRDDSFLAALRSVTYDTPVKAKGRCLLAVRIQSSDQLNGVINQLSAIAEAILPVWTGTEWVEQVTRHPAWAYNNVFQGTANKRAVADERMSLSDLKAWAAAAPDRTFDAVIDYPTTVFELASDIAASSRCRFGMPDSKFSVVRDVPQAVPIQHFTPRNSFGFRGRKTFAKLPHALRCRYRDEDRQDQVVVYDDGYDETNATRFETMDLFGISSADLAWKDGRYHMAQGKLRPETYELSCDMDHLVCTSGDLVRVASPVPQWGGKWGRVKSRTLDGGGDVGSVTLDETVSMEGGEDYSVRFRHSDGSESLASVTTEAGETTVLTFASPIDISLAPETDDLAMFGQHGKDTVDLLVKAIRDGGSGKATLSLVDAAPEVHQADTGPIPDFDTQSTEDPTTAAPGAVAGLVLDEVVRFPSGMAVSDVVAHWRPPLGGFVGGYEVYLWDQGRWRLQTVTTAMDYVVAQGRPRGEAFSIAVLAVGLTGRKLELPDAATATLTTAGDIVAPGDLRTLTVEQTPNGTRRFNAGFDRAVDHDGFLFRYHVGSSRHWESANRLHSGTVRSLPFETAMLASGTYTVLAKAVDTSGNESTNAAVVVLGLGDRLVENVVQTVDLAGAGFGGTVVGGSVTGGEVVADDPGEPFWSASAEPFWYGDAVSFWGSGGDPFWVGEAKPFWRGDSEPFWFAVYNAMTYEDSFTAEGPGTLTISVSGRGGLTVEYRARYGKPFWVEDDGPFWSDDSAPFWNVDDWKPYAGPVRTAEGIHDMRISAQSGAARGRISGLIAEIDLEDDVQKVEDLTISVGGTRAVPSRVMRSVKAVNISLQDDGGDAVTWRVLDKDPVNGPLIKLFDANLSATTGLIDVTLQGVRK